MTTPPPWLPAMAAILGLAPQEMLDQLYAVYYTDFRKRTCHYGHLPVKCNNRCLAGHGYTEGFWHLITRDFHGNGARQVDHQRAMRLPWCAPTINNCQDACVKVWRYKEGRGDIRTYIWLEGLDYVIVLQEIDKPSGHFAKLITAFHVDGDSGRRNLTRKHANKVT